jgi:hypothetical protein
VGNCDQITSYEQVYIYMYSWTQHRKKEHGTSNLRFLNSKVVIKSKREDKKRVIIVWDDTLTKENETQTLHMCLRVLTHDTTLLYTLGLVAFPLLRFTTQMKLLTWKRLLVEHVRWLYLYFPRREYNSIGCRACMKRKVKQLQIHNTHNIHIFN